MSGSGTALPNIKQKITLGEFLRRYNIVVTFLAMMLVAVIATKGSFFTGDNMLNVVERASIIGLVALGQGIVILTGGIDLSVNAVMDISFTSIAVLVYGGMSYSMAIVVALLIGGVVGLVNGLLVIKTKIPAWLITLSTMLIVNAIALWWSGTTEIRFGGLQDFINNLEICLGSTLRIEKSGEVIPKCVGVVPEKQPAGGQVFQIPMVCPACGEPAVREETADIKCVNLNCPAQLERLICQP